LKTCPICKEDLEDSWFSWEKDKCMECVLDTLEVEDNERFDESVQLSDH
jgi:hypothetical protein